MNEKKASDRFLPVYRRRERCCRARRRLPGPTGSARVVTPIPRFADSWTFFSRGRIGEGVTPELYLFFHSPSSFSSHATLSPFHHASGVSFIFISVLCLFISFASRPFLHLFYISLGVASDYSKNSRLSTSSDSTSREPRFFYFSLFFFSQPFLS